METKERPGCSVFSAQEISALRSVKPLLITILGLLTAFIALLFIPSMTILSISEKVVKVATLLDEREKRVKEDQKNLEERLSKIEEGSIELSKQFYKKLWYVEKNSREANEKLDLITDLKIKR